jgi:DNA processing protein
MSILIYTKNAKINDFSPDDREYTQIITTIAKVPKRLWLIGRLPEQRQTTVAIVGTRRPSSYGRDVAYRLAGELASRGVVIVSGLAFGVDSIAHRAALDAGGTTIAIMPRGLDQIAPASHRNLAIDIISKGGALLSEYPPGTETHKANYIERNRLVSGLSDGLLIVEAGVKSGTMHTANFALEQGRSVMAVPGMVTSPASEGCHNLLKAGARLITRTQDVLDELGIADDGQQPLPLGDTSEEQVILNLLHQGIRDGEELQRRSLIPADSFACSLSMLEITGKIRVLGGNQWGLGRG